MIEKIKELHWPATVVIVVALVAMTSVLLFAPEDVRGYLLGPGGAAALLIAWLLPATKKQAADRRSLPPPKPPVPPGVP